MSLDKEDPKETTEEDESETSLPQEEKGKSEGEETESTPTADPGPRNA
jgi:hypothetical protein